MPPAGRHLAALERRDLSAAKRCRPSRATSSTLQARADSRRCLRHARAAAAGAPPHGRVPGAGDADGGRGDRPDRSALAGGGRRRPRGRPLRGGRRTGGSGLGEAPLRRVYREALDLVPEGCPRHAEISRQFAIAYQMHVRSRPASGPGPDPADVWEPSGSRRPRSRGSRPSRVRRAPWSGRAPSPRPARSTRRTADAPVVLDDDVAVLPRDSGEIRRRAVVDGAHSVPTSPFRPATCRRETAWLSELRGRDSNPDYLIQSQASYH